MRMLGSGLEFCKGVLELHLVFGFLLREWSQPLLYLKSSDSEMHESCNN